MEIIAILGYFFLMVGSLCWCSYCLGRIHGINKNMRDTLDILKDEEGKE